MHLINRIFPNDDVGNIKTPHDFLHIFFVSFIPKYNNYNDNNYRIAYIHTWTTHLSTSIITRDQPI